MAAERAKRGLEPDQPVTIMIEPEGWLAAVRRVSRPWVIAQGRSNDDSDRIIKEERAAVQSEL